MVGTARLRHDIDFCEVPTMLTVKDVLGSFHRTWHPVQSTAYAFVSGFDPMADSNILPGPASIGSVDHGSDASSPRSLRPRS